MHSQKIIPGIIITLFVILFVIASCDMDTTRTTDDDNDEPGEEFSHTRNPGTSTEAFLRDDDFTELLVEVQYMTGYRPTDEALQELRSFLEEHLHKAEIIILEPEEIEAAGQDEYTANEIRDLEAEHRQHFSEENTLASYNLIVDGEYSDANVLGIAYYNTSNAFFGRTIHDVSGSPPLNPPREKVEGTVFRHEYGHLFGLVDSGLEMQDDHQENGPHCSEEECVMYYAMTTSDFFANMFDGTIPDLDEFCRADIQAVQE